MSPVFSPTELSQHLYCVDPSAAPGVGRADRTHDLLMRAVDADGVERERLHEEVVLLNVEVAESIVMRYRNRGVPVEDLVQVACLGLVKAVHGFDATKSDNFLSYAVPTILGEVKRFFRDNAWVVRPPRRIQELQAEISASSARLMHESGRPPTPNEIADDLDLEVAVVSEALTADGCFSPSSLDRPAGDDATATLSDVLGDNDPAFERAEAVVVLRPLCKQLSERDRRIIYLRFFHEWTQARIAEEFGVTQMQVSRLLTRILKQLRMQLGATDAPVDGKATTPMALPHQPDPTPISDEADLLTA